MPWINPELNDMIQEAKKRINEAIASIELTAPVLVANSTQMKQEILTEAKLLHLSKKDIEDRVFLSDYAVGKYFKLKHEIWLLEGKGENINTIIHEYLHSIQKCDPNRERIVEYITYKITSEKKGLSNGFIEDWMEIENNLGFNQVIARLMTEGDCEDF